MGKAETSDVNAFLHKKFKTKYLYHIKRFEVKLAVLNMLMLEGADLNCAVYTSP